MISKGWKAFVIAPLAMTLMTACGGSRGGKSNSDNSRFTGLWLAQSAWEDFAMYKNDRRAFCDAAMGPHASHHGVLPQNRIRVPAYMISGIGEVYEYSPTLANASTSRRYLIGQLNDNGTFKPPAATPDSRSAYDYTSYRPGWDSTTFQRDGDNRLTVWRPTRNRGGVAPMTFVRVSDPEMLAYTRTLSSCSGGTLVDPTLVQEEWYSFSARDFAGGPGGPPPPPLAPRDNCIEPGVPQAPVPPGGPIADLPPGAQLPPGARIGGGAPGASGLPPCK